MPKDMDVVEWLEKQRDDRVIARETLEAEHAQGTMSMAPSDDGSTKYLYTAAQEIKSLRTRMELATKILKERGITLLPAITICPNTGKECERSPEKD